MLALVRARRAAGGTRRRPRPRALAAGRCRRAPTGRPFVVQLWGTDVELARRAPWLARRMLQRARLAICASQELADAARELGARAVRVIPSGVDVPETVGEPDEPPHVLFAGRLSPEKGVLELVEAARGPPARRRRRRPAARPRARGARLRPARRLLRAYERAAVVACPSLREGFGVVCAEAMAHGRPVVASAVGGLRDLVVDGETGLLVPPGDVAALRNALERLLGDAELRRRLGDAARARAREALLVGAIGGADADRLRGGRRRSRSARLSPREASRADDRRRPDRRRHRLLRHRRDRPQPPGLAGAGEGALRRGGATAARTRSSCRSATTAALYTREVYNKPYENENSFGPTYGQHREALEFGRDEYLELKAYAQSSASTFFATAFDFKSADFLADLDMPAYKIASGDLTNTPLLRYVAEIGKPMIVSTGGGDARRRPPRATTRSPRSTRRSRCCSAPPATRPSGTSSTCA